VGTQTSSSPSRSELTTAGNFQWGYLTNDLEHATQAVAKRTRPQPGAADRPLDHSLVLDRVLERHIRKRKHG
jgi:hypothetical protein